MEQEDFRKSFVNFLKHLDKADLSDTQRLSRLSQIYRYTLTFFTDQARVQFTSLFSRLSYIINSYDISGKDSTPDNLIVFVMDRIKEAFVIGPVDIAKSLNIRIGFTS